MYMSTVFSAYNIIDMVLQYTIELVLCTYCLYPQDRIWCPNALATQFGFEHRSLLCDDEPTINCIIPEQPTTENPLS